MSVMLTGVVMERLPRWATEEAGRGERLPRVTTAGRWLLYGVLFIPVLVCVYLSRNRINFARVPRRLRHAGAQVDQRARADQRGSTTSRTGSSTASTRFTIAFKNDVTNWLINPLQDLLALSPWWLTAGRAAVRRLRARRLAADGDHAGLRGRHPRHRAVERHHDHAGDDPGRDA